MSEISIIVKPTAGGQKFSITSITGATTIAELKEKVQEKTDIAPAEQRLIFKGQVLKDERDVASYGVEHDNVMHLVKSRPAASGSTGAGSGGSAANGQPAAAPAASAAVSPPAFGNMGLFANQAGTGQGMEEQMAAIMNSPVMQSMLDNPELLRTMLQANPGIQQVMNSNPEFAQLLNNPEMLRESLRMATNPALMREQMRSNDRALSNIESHPEGYNHLRRLYENVQAPLMEAADSAATGPAAANPFASLFQAPTAAAPPPATGASPAASHAPNTAPLPNPWAPAAAGAASAGGGAPPAGAECMGMFGAGLPGLGRAGGGTPPNVDGMMQAIQNPAMQQVMQQLVAQPGFMEAMMNSNPQMRAMAESSPEVRAMLQNPEAMRQMMNPETMQAMVNMQRAMQQLQGSGAADLFGGLPAGGPQPGGAPGAGAPDLSGLMGMLNTGGFGGVPAAPPVANPEEAYAMQIQQLVDMGFYDRDANVRALTATAGNVNAAVERLLQS